MALNPEENFTIAYNLTETGAQSHYASGKGIREFFDKQNGGAGFLSKDYDEKEIYIQTSYKQRTIDSARSQLEGLYGKPLSWPEVAHPEFNLNIIPQMEDFIVHVTDEDCARFAGIVDSVKADSDTSAMMGQVDADMEATLFPELRILTNMPDASTEDMHDVCNYIFWAKENYLELSFEMTDEQWSQC